MKNCPKCGVKHVKNGIFCSRTCANSRTWTEEDKKKKSEIAKNSEKIKLANSNPDKKNKLKKAVEKQKLKGNLNWSKLHSKESKEKRNKTLIKKRETWLNNLDKEIKTEYRKACQFRFNLKDYPEEFNFELIKEYGWYKAKNKGDNLGGVSRDHMYSISKAYKNKIDPYYISHPANCKLMRHIDNKKKDIMNSITIEELMIRIEEWDKKYKINGCPIKYNSL
jgi:hypothetical protein